MEKVCKNGFEMMEDVTLPSGQKVKIKASRTGLRTYDR